MNSVTVTLADHSYALRSGTSIRRLERSLVAAARRGAGIIRLPLAAGREIHALVSPATPVTIEFADASRAAGSAAPTGVPAPASASGPAVPCGGTAAPRGHRDSAEWAPDPPLDMLDLECGLSRSL